MTEQAANGKYILDGHTPVLEPDLLKWAEYIETGDRIVKQENIGEVEISTVFLGLDHSFGSSTPILFETMVFRGELDQEMDRCSTWEEAEKMHEKMIEKVKQRGTP